MQAMQRHIIKITHRQALKEN